MGKQHADNVFGSKLAAKQDIAASLWPTLGATLLYLVPGMLLSLVFRTACFDAEGALRELSDVRLLAYAGAYLLATLLIDKPLYFGLTQFYALRRAGAGVYRIRVIHGCNSGTALRELVRTEYARHPRVLRIADANPGVTELVLREF